jgi:hypothetical protein
MNDFVSAESGYAKLKSSVVEPNKLYIESDNGTAQSSTSVLLGASSTNNYESSDVKKLFSQMKEVPEIYTISGDKALDINEFSSYPYTVPVGINTTTKGNIKLKFTGTESFEGVDVSLINTATGDVQDLKQNGEYTFNYDGTNGEGNLFVELRQATVTTSLLSSSQNNEIQVLTTGNGIKVISTQDNLLKEVKVYDAAGKLVTSKRNIKNSSLEIELNPDSGVLMLRITTEKCCITKKLRCLNKDCEIY